jgi:hypothetical protein
MQAGSFRRNGYTGEPHNVKTKAVKTKADFNKKYSETGRRGEVISCCLPRDQNYGRTSAQQGEPR